MRISDWCSDVCSSDLFFFSRAFELLRQEKPEIISILSSADPMRRIGPAGDVIMPGHVGRAYQCFGAAYRGRTKPRSEMATPDVQIFSESSISQLRSNESGIAYRSEERRVGKECVITSRSRG